MAEDHLLRAGAAHALDHRGVVQLVGQDDAVGQHLGDGRDRRLVGDEARGEDQRRFLAVEVGELGLELDQRVVGAGDVARAAGADAHPPGRVGHGRDHRLVLAHAEIVVGAPDDDLAGLVPVPPQRVGEAPGDALQIGEDAIAPLGMERGDRLGEDRLIVHRAALLFRTLRN